MNDLERIKYIETKLGFQLNQVSLDNLLTENSFLATSNFWVYSLLDRLDPKFYYKGVRNYSLDEDGNVTGLALDYCGLFVLEDNYLGNFEHLKKLKLKSSRLTDYNFFLKLKNLTSLDLSYNQLSNADFLAELKGLTSLDLSYNQLSNYDFLAELKGLTSLALSYNQLSNADFLAELKGLTSLDLRNNKLSNADFLAELKGLTSLALRNNKLSNADFLAELKGLTSLDLSYNQLSNADFLAELKGLTSLVLSYNQLSNYDFLAELKGLTSLALRNNQLSNYDFLAELKGLTSLDLSSNQLSNYDFLAELKGLTSLDLSSNQLSNYDFLAELKGLTSLDLRNNQLSNADFLAELKGLTSLDLSYNQLSNADFLAELKGLTSLALSSNNLSNADFLKDLRSLTYINLDDNPITNPPKEIVEQGLQEIWKYFDEIKEQGIDYIYEAKVLIVGETETGKTTLFMKLLDNDYLPQKGSEDDKKSTVGINIKPWEFPYTINNEQTIKANLWDFGGQEIQYTLHQYFLTKKSFYIFLISNRVGDNESIHKADYWFKVITLLGKDCPVLVILNERNDNSANNFNIEKYKKQFGKELGEIEKLDVNFSSNDRKWNSLLTAIKEKISNLPHIGKGINRGLPKQWVEVRRRIEAIKDNHITLSAYEEICKDVGLYEKPQNKETDKPLAQNLLLRFLHNLGVVINYDDAYLRNYLILNPTWLTESLYMVLEDKIIKDEQSGKFTSKFINDLWKGKSYSDTDYYILLNLMLKDNFEIAYKVQGKDDDYVIPMLLPEPSLDYEFGETNLITLIIRFTFMPHGVFSRLIVQLNNFIDVQMIEGQNKQVVWKRGMLLRSKENSFAEVIESDDKEQTPKEIKIRVSGANALENKRFLNQIVGHIYQINKDWFRDNLEFDRLIPCICDDCKDQSDISKVSLYKLKDLLRKAHKGNEFVECNVDDKEANISKMLDGIYFENYKERKDFGDTFNNYYYDKVSVAKGDNATANQYINAGNNEEFNEKLDAMFEKLGQSQANEMEKLADELFKLIDERLVTTNKLSEEQVKEVENLKLNSDWKAKLKFGLPLSQLIGVSFEVEKEWKLSKEIKAESFISALRKINRGEEVQITGFNNLE